MKPQTILPLLLCLAGYAFAMPPQAAPSVRMQFQVLLRDSSNLIISERVVNARVSITIGSIDGAEVYSANAQCTTSYDGQAHIPIYQNGIDTIHWADGPYFLHVAFDPDDDGSYGRTYTAQLLTVPYAFHAKTTDSVTNNPETDPQFLASPASTLKAGEPQLWQQRIDRIDKILADNNLYLIADVEGNQYHTIRIGNQVWMSENLKTTHYNDGTPIPAITDQTIWANLTTPGFCWYNNDKPAHHTTYGVLYNWHAVNTGNLCPTGWKVPTGNDIETLNNALGGTAVGGQLKETGTVHWTSPNEGATNESGFTALPGGRRNPDGSFIYLHDFGFFWGSSQLNASEASAFYLYHQNTTFFGVGVSKNNGYSVRCIKE